MSCQIDNIPLNKSLPSDHRSQRLEERLDGTNYFLRLLLLHPMPSLINQRRPTEAPVLDTPIILITLQRTRLLKIPPILLPTNKRHRNLNPPPRKQKQILRALRRRSRLRSIPVQRALETGPLPFADVHAESVAREPGF